ncbi:MAG: hypothetical protein FWH53_06915, partial [Leptospirales bacterium]|nr:hypothetical protein [Leptospirales bacterium]
MKYTPRQRLEIRGAFYYIIGYTLAVLSSAIFQVIADVGLRSMLLNLVISAFNISIGTLVYKRKKKGLKVKLLPWILGFTTTLLPIAVKYTYGFEDGWTFALQSMNTTAVLILFVILLAFFYQPKLFRFFSIYAMLHWILVIYIGYLHGAELHLHIHDNGVPILTGLILMRESSFFVAILILFVVIYRILSEIIKYDHKSTKQYNQIVNQSDARNMITEIIREKTDTLFQKIDSQHTLLNNFNANMESQAARFSEMSATMEEISSSSDQIAVETSTKLVDGNITVESIVEEFKGIRVETK